jgi:hypothetical protein
MCDSIWPKDGPFAKPRRFAQGKVVALALEYRRACRAESRANKLIHSYMTGSTHTSEMFINAHRELEKSYQARRRAADDLLAYVAGRWA